jgi:hypothetical protein
MFRMKNGWTVKKWQVIEIWMKGNTRRRGMEQDTLEDGLGDETPLVRVSHEEDEKEYEALLDMVGFGKFQIYLLLVCGWANASDAVEILCVSFILPSADCDLDLTPLMKGVLTAIIFFGMMIGGYMWGCLGDSLGRKNTLVSSLLMNTLGKSLCFAYGIPILAALLSDMLI